MESTERKIGEMFTSSGLKKITPWYQFSFAIAIALIAMLIGKYYQSKDLLIYGGSFALVFFVLWNPWLVLLAQNNKAYFYNSLMAYFIMNMVIYGLMYLWAGVSIINSPEIAILLFSTSFYGIVSYLTMLAIKMLFLDMSEGGI